MKVTLLEVENFKRIKKIKLAPGARSMVLIAGNNRQGKSSLLGAMSAALGGGKAAPEEPVRKGEEQADIFVELDDGALVVHRRFYSNGKSSLEVRSKDGTLRSPQKILDRIVGTRFLDPLKFSRLDEKRQRAVLLGCVDIGIDLEDHGAERKRVYDNRTDANREVKRLKTELAAAPEPGDIPEQVSAAELLTELTALTDRDADRAEAEYQLRDMRDTASTHEDVVSREQASLREAIEALEELIESQRTELAEAKAGIEERKSAVAEAKTFRDDHEAVCKSRCPAIEVIAATNVSDDIIATRSKIAESSAHNEQRALLVAAKEAHARAGSDLAAATEVAAGLTVAIESLDAIKAAALAAANMPIAGLDIDATRVLYGDVPLSQASGAEQLQVSLAIAAALSPELGDIWLEDGSLLDGNSLELVHQFAKDNDLRIWLERVGEGDDDCIIIEAGEVKP